jgi:hypothetical protein
MVNDYTYNSISQKLKICDRYIRKNLCDARIDYNVETNFALIALYIIERSNHEKIKANNN